MGRKYCLFGIFIMIIFFCCAAGCGRKEAEPVLFRTEERDGYLVILYGEREYVPYCPFSSRERGDYLGYIEGEEDEQIYEWKGHLTEEWLISYLDSGLMNDTLLYKETGVTEIPESIVSEYEWNQ